MEWVMLAVGVAAGFAAALLPGLLGRRKAHTEAESLIAKAREEAEEVRREAEAKGRAESLKRREEVEGQIGDERRQVQSLETRLNRKENQLDEKFDLLGKKEKYTENLERTLSEKRTALEERDKALIKKEEEARATLFRVSGLTTEQGRKEVLDRIQKELQEEEELLIQRMTQRVREQSEEIAKKTITLAIQRHAADHTSESVVSSVDIPDDEMKGRIIGREGRNIRAFEKVTGVDVIVDDTPGVVVVSGFDPIRREVARRSLEKLIQDGRIHPARIEEVVDKTRSEVDKMILEGGRSALMDLGIHGVHPKEVYLLGKLQFRTSYGQNVLKHSIEVANLCAAMAGELKLDPVLAKRCGLLHDMGKAVDHEMEGGHPELGADLARRFGEHQEVLNAILGHHDGASANSIYAVLVSAADAISASRPGARRESYDKYVKRLERLEAIANSFPGVENAYAIQAGREVRVIVNADKVDDSGSLKTCRDIAKEIENELSYPGEVKVTLVRERRVVEYAR